MKPSEGIGVVAALWRYPVKSMLGEELAEVWFSGRGVWGDRVYAVADAESGQVRNAKRAGWEGLFGFGAALAGDDPTPPVRISAPGGVVIGGDGEDRDRLLSGVFGRGVRLVSDAGDGFFDLGAVHLLTTASLRRLGGIRPGSRFDPRRFRPNVVLDLDSPETGFVEDNWLGCTLRLGDEVVLEITDPVARCTMVNLAQADLAKDPGILRTVYRHNDNRVGVYAEVREGGRVRRGDRAVLL